MTPKTRNRRVRFSDEVKEKIIKTDTQNEDFKHPKPLKPAEDDIFVDVSNTESEGIIA